MTLDEVNSALVTGAIITHNNDSVKCRYRISGVITRYSREKGWTYSLELRDLKADCIVYARLEDCQIIKQEGDRFL